MQYDDKKNGQATDGRNAERVEGGGSRNLPERHTEYASEISNKKYLLNKAFLKNKKIKKEVISMNSNKQLSVSGESIRLRLTQDMKKWLFKKSEKENRTVSDIMRNLIQSEMNK